MSCQRGAIFLIGFKDYVFASYHWSLWVQWVLLAQWADLESYFGPVGNEILSNFGIVFWQHLESDFGHMWNHILATSEVWGGAATWKSISISVRVVRASGRGEAARA